VNRGLPQAVEIIPQLLNASLCATLIACAQSAGFRPARLESMGRRNQEAVIISPPVLERIELSLRAGCAQAGWTNNFVMGSWIESYRYGPGDYVAPHADASRRLKDETLSTHAAVIYLNDEFEGGETCFPQVPRNIQPERGAAVIFENGLLHHVTAVSRGTRYILRVDLALSG
jgi:hypothetical protein